MTKSKTSLNIVGILLKSIYKIVLRYLFQTDISVYNFQRPSSKTIFICTGIQTINMDGHCLKNYL